MPQKIRKFLVFVYNNFGPLVLFYGVNHFWGLKPAIAASTVLSVIEVATKLYRKEKITGLFIFSAGMTLIFGVVDLYSTQSFLFKYESTVTNIVTACFFGWSIFAEKTVIQEVYEAKPDAKKLGRDHIVYFKMLTGVWVIYFLAKAAVYFVIAGKFDLEQALVIRFVIGNGSFYLMLFISMVGSKKIFPLMKRLKLLPESGLGGATPSDAVTQ